MNARAEAGRAPRQEPALDRLIQAQIGDKLRAMYGDLVEQPVPDRINAILSKLASPSPESTS